MDPSCPGRESVCLGMMKSSTCPHSSSPLHILIITNLQTYSRGHTDTCRPSHLPVSHGQLPRPTPLPHTYTSVTAQWWWSDTDAGQPSVFRGHPKVTFSWQGVTSQIWLDLEVPKDCQGCIFVFLFYSQKKTRRAQKQIKTGPSSKTPRNQRDKDF